MEVFLWVVTLAQVVHLTVLSLFRPRLLASASLLFAIGFLVVFSFPVLIRFELISELGISQEFFLVSPFVVGVAQAVLQIQFFAMRDANRRELFVETLKGSNNQGSLALRALVAFATVSVFVVAMIALLFPLTCSGLYSLIFDPSRALLARDITYKSNPSFLVTMAISALSNFLGPAIGGLGIAVVLDSSSVLGRRRYFVGFLAIIYSVALVLIPAVDGNVLILLVAMLLAISVVSASKLLKVLVATVLVSGMVPIILLVDGAPSTQGSSQAYEIGFCVNAVLSPESTLISILINPGGSAFGLAPTELNAIAREYRDEWLTNTSAPKGTELMTNVSLSQREAEAARELYDTSEAGILNRIFFVPVESAVAYFVYSEHFKSSGTNIFPFAFLWGQATQPDSEDIAALVAGLGESSLPAGSTAGSNSPYVWSSALGYPGLIAALLITASFLLLQTRLLVSGDSVANTLGASLGGVFVMNYFESDLWAVLFSHSGYFIVIVFVFLSLRMIVRERERAQD